MLPLSRRPNMIDTASRESEYEERDISTLGLDEESDDEDLNNYHKLLMEAYTDQVVSQPSQHGYEPSHYSHDQLESQYSGITQDKMAKTDVGEAMREKRKYMKQQAKRIKQELKNQQAIAKKEKRQVRELELQPIGRKRGKSGKRKKLTKKTLQLLKNKFDEYYAQESNYNEKGTKISIREIGQIFNMNYSTITKLYAQWMEDASFSDRFNREIRKKIPERKITLERLEHVARLIKENPFLTQNELTVELNKIDDLKFTKDGEKVDITRTTVARLLKVGKFKKKRVKCVPKERNTTKSLQKRHDYCTQYRALWERRAQVYFLDESGFNLYMTRDKAWARPNEEITVNCPISKGKRFSLIAIIAEDGLTHWRIIEGTYRKYEYLDFIKQLFTRLREEEEADQGERREKWLVLDNCAIHDKEQTVSLGQECGMQILYLPPYSPQLNPIENWFNEVKAKIRKINYSGEKQLLEVMHSTLNQYENFDFSNYYRGILKHVQKGINREKF